MTLSKIYEYSLILARSIVEKFSFSMTTKMNRWSWKEWSEKEIQTISIQLYGFSMSFSRVRTDRNVLLSISRLSQHSFYVANSLREMILSIFNNLEFSIHTGTPIVYSFSLAQGPHQVTLCAAQSNFIDY